MPLNVLKQQNRCHSGYFMSGLKFCIKKYKIEKVTIFIGFSQEKAVVTPPRLTTKCVDFDAVDAIAQSLMAVGMT